MENKDFDKLLWQVHKIDLDRDNIFQKIPDISYYDEFSASINLPINNVIAYIVYCYDMNSPIVRKYDNINRRKKLAAKKAGFDESDGVFNSKVDSMLSGNDIVINGMILRYCRIQNNDDWGLMQTFREAMHKLEKKLIAPDDKSSEKDIIKNLTTLRDELNNISKKFLVNDRTDGLVYDFHTAIESDDLIPRPEEIAKRIQQKERILPVWFNPYKEGVNG